MDETLVIDAFLVELDKPKKYLMMITDDSVDLYDIRESIRKWLSFSDMPILLVYENQIKLLEVEEESK